MNDPFVTVNVVGEAKALSVAVKVPSISLAVALVTVTLQEPGVVLADNVSSGPLDGSVKVMPSRLPGVLQL